MVDPHVPEETPMSILRNVAQQIQSVLDTDHADPVLLPRAWAVAWLEDLQVAIATLRHHGH